MEKFECQKCGKTSYSASKAASGICPYCDIEKLLIFNPSVLAMSHELSDAKIIVDRRMSHRPVNAERRENEEMIPVAWLVIKQKELAGR